MLVGLVLPVLQSFITLVKQCNFQFWPNRQHLITGVVSLSDTASCGFYFLPQLLHYKHASLLLHAFTGIMYKPPEYQEHDFSEAPRFTTPLSDHAATVGYTTKLLCSVRGSPKVRQTHVQQILLLRLFCVLGSSKFRGAW